MEHKVTENLKGPILGQYSFEMLCSVLLDIGVTPICLTCLLAPPLPLCDHTPAPLLTSHRKS